MGGISSDVASYLENQRLGEFCDLFVRQEIDMEAFKDMKDQDLRDIGLKKMGDRIKLLAAIDMCKRSPHLTGVPNPEGLFYLNRYAIETAGSMGGESVVKYATDTKTGLPVCLKF